MLLGQLDHYDALTRSVHGWAADNSNPHVACIVEARCGNKVVAEAVANKYREDLEWSGIHSGCHSFDMVLPEIAEGDIVTLYDRASGTPLQNGEIHIRSPASAVSFYIDYVDGGLIGGWVTHELHREPLIISLHMVDLEDGQVRLVANGVADQFRPDVDEGRYCGFTLEQQLQMRSSLVTFIVSVGGVVVNSSYDVAVKEYEAERHSLVSTKQKILFISHDASLTGAPSVLLDVARWVRSQTDLEPMFIVGGPHKDRIPQFLSLGECLHIEDVGSVSPQELSKYLDEDIKIIYANTVASASLLLAVNNAFLDKHHMPLIITHIHEKKGVLDYFHDSVAYIIEVSDRIIVVSGDIKKDLINKGVCRRKPIMTIPPFIEPLETSKFQEAGAVPTIYGCGTIEHRKGFDLFCSSIAVLKKKTGVAFRAVWVGRSSSEDEPDKSISKYEVADLVNCIGQHSNPRELYRQGDIFFMPSREDPFPLVCMEAAEKELAILCFDERAGESATFVRNSQGGLICDYLNVEDAAFCLKQLLEAPEMRVNMGVNARNYLYKHHVTAKVAPEIYEYITADSSPVLSVGKKSTLIVVSFGPIPVQGCSDVEGGGLRSWGLARGLASTGELDVFLSFPDWYVKGKLPKVVDNVNIMTWGDEAVLLSQIEGRDIVLVSYCYGSYSEKILDAMSYSQTLILDCYVPIHAEVCARASKNIINEYHSFMSDSGSWGKMLRSGDYLLCASDAQRYYYFGLLFGVGKIQPISYKNADNIILAPFGIDEAPPVRKADSPLAVRGEGRSELKILWFGGVYPWFDIEILVKAVSIVRESIPCNLTIVGAKNPFNNHPDFKEIADRVSSLSTQATYKDFLYIEDWVAYEDRTDWYLDADLIVSINQEAIENNFAWRTRVLDYLWAEVSFATNGGDPVSELLLSTGLANIVDTSSPGALAQGLCAILDGDKASIDKEKLELVKSKLTWSYIGNTIFERISLD